MIRAVVFDFDNTLGNRYKAAYLCFRKLLSEHAGIKPDTLEMETIVQDLCVWEQGGAADKGYIVARLKDKYGIDIDEQFFRNWWTDNLNSFSTCFDGAVEVLEYCRKKYLLGCITNGSSQGQNGKLRNAGIYDYFDCIVISGEAGVAKPDKGIFEKMAENLKVAPEECLFVGDAFSLDITGALQSGYKAVWVFHNPHQPCLLDIVRINDIRQLMEII